MASLGVERGTSPALEVGRFRGWDTGDWLARPRQLGGGNRDAIGQSQNGARVGWMSLVPWFRGPHAAAMLRFGWTFSHRFWEIGTWQHMDRAGCRWPGLGCRRCLAKSKSRWDLWLIPCNLLGEVPFYSTILWDDLGFLYIYNIIYIIYHDLSWFIAVLLRGFDVFKQWKLQRRPRQGGSTGATKMVGMRTPTEGHQAWPTHCVFGWCLVARYARWCTNVY